MDPPSPSKLGMSPPWKPRVASPEHLGREVPYGEPLLQSPSMPHLGAIPPLSPTRSPTRSPIRSQHRRTDSDVSVQGLATMFEGLEVKDPREAVQRYKQLLDKEKLRFVDKLKRQEKEHTMSVERRALRIEELESELALARSQLQAGVSRAQYEKEYMDNKANVKRWEQLFKEREDQWNSDHRKLADLKEQQKNFASEKRALVRREKEMQKENLKVTSMVPNYQSQIQGLKRDLQRAESDRKFKSEEAAKYQNQVYNLQVQVESNAAQLGQEIQTLKDKLMLMESERDALKLSLKEEEVMRIASEGQIPLPTAGADEKDHEFGTPLRSPRKQHNFPRGDDDKENVSPKKCAVDLKFIQQELATERRLRERAQDQIEFMKMECQFQCCSCRIAENQGKTYIHDNTHAAAMQRIKMSVPTITPPSSVHEGDSMDGVVIKQEVFDDERPLTPPADTIDVNIVPAVEFSPSTGTFRAVSSPIKAPAVSESCVSKPVEPEVSSVTHQAAEASIRKPEAYSMAKPTVVEEEKVSRRGAKENRAAVINIHEDVFEEDDEDEPQSPAHEPSTPATPFHYQLRTTTTTIPLHFSPATPAFKPGRGPMTPSTIAHAAEDARTPILSELSLNIQPVDREAALEAIRQRRGRTRSMAAGHGTPLKQMVEGAKDRRDISAPVLRARR